MDIAEIATMAFIALGMTYNAVKYRRVNLKVHLAREWPVHLILEAQRMICRKSAGEQSCWFLTDGDIWCASTLIGG